MAKVLTGWLQPHIAPQLCKFAGPDQYAGPAQGTTIANHTLRTFRDVAMLQKWSTAIVYFDLSKAFDTACREVVLGWPGLVEMSVERGTQLLGGLGFNEKSSGAIATRVCTKGSILSEAGVCISAIRSLNSLHEQAWVQVCRGNDTEKVRLGTRRGGRQGCRFGPDIFNAAFAAALQDVMNDIQKLGLFVCCSQLKKLDFWSAGDVEPPHLGSPRPNEQRAGKVVYVDDLGLMLAAATPGSLMKKLPCSTGQSRGTL